ncbi:MAG: helix-turn-helix domain-containing protein [Gemmatimonadales bacterium]
MKPLLVLLLDGDADRRQAIATLLREAGHQVALAETSADLEKAAGTYDLIVLDPDSDSFDVTALSRIGVPALQGTPDSLNDAERRHVALVLRHTAGNKRKAAHLLGISRSTLLNKVRKYGLES